MGSAQRLRTLYRQLGDTLLKQCPGFKFTIITDDPELSKSTGLRAEKINRIMNGPLNCIITHFNLNTESRYQSKSPEEVIEKLDDAATAFMNRLKKRLKQLQKYNKKNNITSFRVYDADLPDYNLAIDYYEGKWIYVQEYAPPSKVDPRVAEQRIRNAMKIIPLVFETNRESIFLKVRQKQKGKDQYERQGDTAAFVVMKENGAKFWVNFHDYLDTGIFLDHRLTRAMIGNLSKGKDVLNLFCYTGTATVMAIKGGAKSTVSVDSSNTYLEWMKKNLTLNHLEGTGNEIIRDDVMQWLRHCRKKFDMVFLDPPTFSNKKSTNAVFDIQNDHPELIGLVKTVLRKKGIIIFSTNFRRFKLLTEQLHGFSIEDITESTIPFDFSRNQKIHRCYKLELK